MPSSKHSYLKVRKAMDETSGIARKATTKHQGSALSSSVPKLCCKAGSAAAAGAVAAAPAAEPVPAAAAAGAVATSPAVKSVPAASAGAAATASAEPVPADSSSAPFSRATRAPCLCAPAKSARAPCRGR